jgi:hypothetical protein
MTDAERYLVLGLRLGRHVDGLVDAYFGPPELQQQVDAEPVAEPAALVDEAGALLAALEDGWLRDQVRGLHTYARVLAGDPMSYSDEVEGCYGVRPTPPDEAAYAEVHARLDELLPGTGTLTERREAFRASQLVPKELLLVALTATVDELRTRTAALLPLPEGESVVLEAVGDEPWWAFNYYLGGLRSRVVVNVDVPTTAADIAELAAHEVYPGHHTEHSSKEQLLLREQGLLDEAIALVPTPQAVVSEGIAETGGRVVLGAEGEAAVLEILRRHGLAADERALAVRDALQPLRRLGLDAALMIHEQGATAAEAQAHLEHWGVMAPERAAQSVRFVTDPTWRAYVVTYSAGHDLCAAYLRGDPQRLRRLLTERVRVGDLVA